MLGAQDYYVGLYWGARKETVRECALRANRFLCELRLLHPFFNQWSETRRESESTVVEGNIERLFVNIETDKFAVVNEEVSELGFRLTLINNDTQAAAVYMSVTCGCFCKWVPTNCVVMHPPQDLVARREFLRIPLLLGLIRAAVHSWEPDIAVVTSHQLEERLGIQQTGPRVGWLTYVSHKRFDTSPLADIARVEPLDNFGNIIVASEELMSADHPGSAERLQTILNALEALRK